MKQFNLIFRTFFALSIVLAFHTAIAAQDSGKKVALTSFFVDRQIGLSDVSGNVAAARDILALAKDTSFNLQSVLHDFKTKFFADYVQHFPFTLKPEAEVIGNTEYQAFEEAFTFDFVRPLTPNGYKIMYPGGFLQKKENRNQNEMLRIFPDADGIMYVFIDYSFVRKVAIAGMGSAGIRATCNIWLYNKAGKPVFRIAEGANSKGSVPLIANIPVMSADKILPLCKDASARLLEDLMGRLPKIAKKAAKKLK
ncbi:MAG: hypothetical protein H7246_00985 [Phycisphaerae bacterium]|nr:hypothetical protein [Saprospiraceae bacterium]